MNYVVCVTGPDNIGKTVLVSKLLKKYPTHITHHFGAIKSKLEGKKLMLDSLKTFSEHNDKVYIFDRCFLGDFVYGPLFRKYDAYSYFDEVYKLFGKCKNTKFLFIFMYADENTYSKFKLVPKSDEKVKYQKKEASEEISIKFIELANKLHGLSNVRRLVVNCNNYETLDKRNEYVTKHVDSFMRDVPYKLKPVIDYGQIIFNDHVNMFDGVVLDRDQRGCTQIEKCEIGKQHTKFSKFGVLYQRPTTYYGNTENPRYIFVGEAPGHLGCGTFGIPFYGDNSGYYLYNALSELGIIHSEIYLTNTVKCCPKGNDLGKYYNMEDRVNLKCVAQLETEILAVGGDPQVIALGKVAGITLDALKIPHDMIYHPAYYLRLNQYAKFRDALKEVLI